MDAEELKQRIDAFPSWNYRVRAAGGHRHAGRERLARPPAEQRRRYSSSRCSRSRAGRCAAGACSTSGCNAGFWSLEAIEAGADIVLGVDGSA